MSKERLIALAGPLTILVGSVWLLERIGGLVLRIGPERPERDWDLFLALWSMAFFLSFVPLLFALIGTRLRFHPSAGALGRIGLALSVGGCAGVVTFMLASILLGRTAPVGEPSWVNYAAVVCMFSIRIGYILFGVDALRYRLLPRWNLVPLLLGLTVVFSFGFEWFGVPSLLPSQWATPFLHFAITGACWVLMGMAMIDPRREPQPDFA